MIKIKKTRKKNYKKKNLKSKEIKQINLNKRHNFFLKKNHMSGFGHRTRVLISEEKKSSMRE